MSGRTWAQRVQEAGVIIHHADDLADKVLRGDTTLDAAHEVVGDFTNDLGKHTPTTSSATGIHRWRLRGHVQRAKKHATRTLPAFADTTVTTSAIIRE